MRSRLLLLGMMCGLSGSAFAQEPAFMIPNDREASAQVAGIIASARDAGLPTQPIVGKVNYGVTVRRSKPSDIVRSVSIVKTRLETARAALAPNPSEQEIIDGANVLGETGGTADMLRVVRKAGGSRSLVSALGLLTQLLASGAVKPPRATEMVTDLLRRSATDGQLVAFQTSIATDVVVGSQLASSIDVRLHNLIATLPAPNGGNAALIGGDKQGFSTSGTSPTPPPPPPKRP